MKGTLTIMASIVAAFLSLTQVYAATYYVSPTGNDGDPGSPTQPFASINKAMETVTDGDTILVAEGVYTNPWTAAGSPGGAQPRTEIGRKGDMSMVNNLTFLGAGPTKTIFRYVGPSVQTMLNAGVQGIVRVLGNNQVVGGFKMEGELYTPTTTNDYTAGIELRFATNCLVRDMWIVFPPENISSSGLYLNWRLGLLDNVISNFLVCGAGAGVRHRYNTGAGYYFSQPTLMTHCTFANQIANGSTMPGAGAWIQENYGDVFDNCVFFNCQTGGVILDTSAGYGIDGTNILTVTNSLWFGTPVLGITTGPGTGVVYGIDNVNIDPEFTAADGCPYIAANGRGFQLGSLPPDASGTWPLNGRTKQRQGWLTNGTPLLAAQPVWSNLWQVDKWAGIFGSGVADADRFYICVDPANGSNLSVLALNLASGDIEWGANLDAWANGTPALSADKVFVGDNAGKAYCLSKTNGAVEWSTALGGPANGGVLLDRGKLYILADTIGLLCLDATNGAVLWTNQHTEVKAWSSGGPSLSPDGSNVYYHAERSAPGSNTCHIVAVDAASGTTLWKREFGWGSGNMQPIVGNDGTVYAGLDGLTDASDPEYVVALDQTGGTKWVSAPMPGKSRFGYALSPDNAAIYCTGNDGMLTALNTANGTVKWTNTCGNSSGGCVVGRGGVVVSVHENDVPTAIGIKDNGTSGTLLWQIPLWSNNWTTVSFPTLLGNGDVIVEASAGVIMRIKGLPTTPFVDITNDAVTVANIVDFYGVAGTNNDQVVGDMWVSNATLGGAAVTFPAKPAWSSPTIAIAVGSNTIVVVGTNAMGDVAFDSVAITRESLPPPFVDITNDAATVATMVDFYGVAGTNNDQIVGDMWLSNATVGGAALTFPAKPDWTSPAIGIAVGPNTIVVYGTNALGALDSDSIVITREPPVPFVDITNVDVSIEFNVTNVSGFLIAGTNSEYTVGDIVWTNIVDGSLAANGVVAAGGWSFDAGLVLGSNVISVVGTNSLGETAQDSATVVVLPEPVVAAAFLVVSYLLFVRRRS